MLSLNDPSQSIVVKNLEPGDGRRFEIRVRNVDESETGSVLLQGQEGESEDNFRVRYFRGDKEITSKIGLPSPGKEFHDIPAGASTPLIELRVKARSIAPSMASDQIPIVAELLDNTDDCTTDIARVLREHGMTTMPISSSRRPR